jgi:hypothetical protein
VKKPTLQLVNTFNEFILIGVLIFVVGTSYYVASNINVQPGATKVLGAISGGTVRSLTVPAKNISNNYTLKYSEDKWQANLDIVFTNKSTDILNIQLGKLTNTDKQDKNFRAVINLADVYASDMNMYLIIDGKQYDFIIDNKQFNQELRLPGESAVNLELKIVPKKPLFYMLETNVTIYK